MGGEQGTGGGEKREVESHQQVWDINWDIDGIYWDIYTIALQGLLQDLMVNKDHFGVSENGAYDQLAVLKGESEDKASVSMHCNGKVALQ